MTTIYQMIVKHVVHKTVRRMRKKNEDRVFYQELDGIPLISLMEYFPLNATDTPERQRNREIVWRFKDAHPKDKKYAVIVKEMLAKFENIIRRLFDDVSDITLVYLPASDTETSRRRWKQFSRQLAMRLGCENGFRHLRQERDSVPRHYIGGRGKPRKLIVDKDYFKGKRIIIVDDLVNTGRTMRNAIRCLSRAGAEIVCCLALATTPGCPPSFRGYGEEGMPM